MSSLVSHVAQIEWIKTVTRAMSPCIQIFQTIGERDFLLDKVGSGFRNKILLPAESGHTQYFGKTDWHNFADAVEKRIEKSIESLETFAAEVYEMGTEYVHYAERVFLDDLASRKDKDLLDYFLGFGRRRLKLAYALYPPLVIERYLENRLKNELEKFLKEKGKEDAFEEYWAAINTKTRLNEADEEEIEVLKIASKVEEQRYNEEVDAQIDRLANRFAWLPYYGFKHPIWDKEYFKHEVRNVRTPKEKLEEKLQALKLQRERIDQIKEECYGTVLEKLVSLMQTFLHLRPFRTEVMRKTQYYMRPLLEVMANRMGVEFEDFLNLTPDEIEGFFEKGVSPSPQEIARRREHHAIVMLDGEIRLISSKEEIESLREVLTRPEEGEVLKGTGVYPGEVRGSVKVVADISEIDKVRPGDILVTTMTTPEMHRAIESAAGIITDEGGITCHAAIVSRELQIPCVIGTSNATRLLHDGDVVHLDSKKGIVKLKK